MHSLDIDIGCRMIIEFPNKERMNCQFVGLLLDEFVLLKVPLTPGIRDRLAEGVSIYCRYLKSGKIISFRSEVLRHQPYPVSLAFISYPFASQAHNLRKECRLDCNLPAEMAVGGRQTKGVIVDISPGGCKFVFSPENMLATKEGVSAVGTFRTLEGDTNYDFKGEVVALQNNGTSLGIRFNGDVELPEGLQQLLENQCVLPVGHPAGTPQA